MPLDGQKIQKKRKRRKPLPFSLYRKLLSCKVKMCQGTFFVLVKRPGKAAGGSSCRF